MPVSRVAVAIVLASSLLTASEARADETISSPLAVTMDMPVMVPAGHVLVQADECVWVDAPPSLPKGAKLAVLEGDLAAAGPFTVRARFPAGYRIPAHTHPGLEHVTVISGTFNLGFGDKLDTGKGRSLKRGGFAVLPAGDAHYAWTEEATEIQLHGTGPWGITYVDAATDPRNAKK